MEVKIIDSNFAHNDYSTLQKSKYFSWYRGEEKRPICFYTDSSLHLAQSSIDDIKIAWLIEPKAINKSPYDFIEHNHHLFDYVLTYDKYLLSLSDKFIFYPHGGCWINDKGIHEKTKLLSIIASDKRATKGHKLRHEAINGIKNNMDVYGRRYHPLSSKEGGLKDYAFSLVIENSQPDYYFTEKLIDAFVCGTVPIYWGCPSIGNYFNTDGMIIFNTIEELYQCINDISIKKYQSMKDVVIDNYERSLKYIIPEDWMYENIKIITDNNTL
jgi:hypothetical protein